MSQARIELTIRVGYESQTVAVPVSEHLLYELSEPMELSDEPFALFVAGGFRGKDVVEVRKKKFAMREGTAKEISAALTKALVEHFGRNDKTDGYAKDQAQTEQCFHANSITQRTGDGTPVEFCPECGANQAQKGVV